MKLRIKGTSLRLRLTQGEIRALAQQGMIEERVPFPHAQLVYRLRREAAARSAPPSARGWWKSRFRKLRRESGARPNS